MGGSQKIFENFMWNWLTLDENNIQQIRGDGSVGLEDERLD